MEQPRKRARPGRAPAPAGRTSRPRQAEVARLAGVSQATVSLVLARQEARAPTISEETRQRVLDAAAQPRLRARPGGPPARRRAQQPPGVFSFTATFPTDVQHSYYPFLVGVEQEAAARGYDLVLFTGSSTGGAGAAGPDAAEPGAPRRRLPLPRPPRATSPNCGGWSPTASRWSTWAAGTSSKGWPGSAPTTSAPAVTSSPTWPPWDTAASCSCARTTRRPPPPTVEQGFLDGLRRPDLPGGPRPCFRSADPAAELTARAGARAGRGRRDRLRRGGDRHRRRLAGAHARRARTPGSTCPGDVSLALLGSPPAGLSPGARPDGLRHPPARGWAPPPSACSPRWSPGRRRTNPWWPASSGTGATAGPPYRHRGRI